MAAFFPRSFPGLPILVAAVVAVAGCSSGGVKKVTVTGTITYKGQPVRSGMLQFVGPEGAYSAAVIQPDGSFTITDVVPGEVKVGVLEAPGGEGSSSGEKSRPAPKPVDLPDKYRNPETSGLKYTITSDTRQLDIKIE